MDRKMYKFRESAVRWFAKYTAAMACIHFALETAYTVRFGQHWLGLVPDYIATGLMMLGAFLIIVKGAGYVGYLCGAWGFAFCLSYRAWAWRFEAFLTGESSALINGVMYVLVPTLVIALASFIVSLWLCIPGTGAQDDVAVEQAELH